MTLYRNAAIAGMAESRLGVVPDVTVPYVLAQGAKTRGRSTANDISKDQA